MSWVNRKGYVVLPSGELLHRKMWEEANGPIPGGHDIHHKDGDKAHNVLTNFELVSHAVHTHVTHKGRRHSEEHRRKNSEAKRGNVPWNKDQPGYHNAKHPPRTDEHRAKISEANKGRPAWNKGVPCSAEAKAKNAAAHKGIPAWNKGIHSGKPAWNKGIPCSAEAKAKISASMKGRRVSPATEFKPRQYASPETRRRMSEAQKKRFHTDVTASQPAATRRLSLPVVVL